MKIIKLFFSQTQSFQKLLFSGGITFLFRLFGLFLNFFITFYITKCYGEEIFGNFSLIITLLQATTMIFALGLPNALISFLGLHKIDDHYSQYLLKKGIRILFVFSVFPALIYFFFGESVSILFFKNPNLIPYFKVFAIAFPFFIIHEFILSFFIATKNFKKYNIFMFVIPNIIFLMLLMFFKIKPENEFLLIFYFSIAVIATVLSACFFAFRKYKFENFEKTSTKQILKFSSPMMLSSLMIFLLNWIAIIMLGALSTPKEVGIYNLVYKLASLAMLVIISINVVLSPKISELYKANKISELQQTIKKSTHLVILLSLPIVVVLIIFSSQILSVFGHQFIEGKTALIIIVLGILINVATGNVDQILNMTGNQKILQRITFLGFALNVLLNFFLIPKYGIIGAAISSLITNLVFNFICLYAIKIRLGFYTFC